MSDLEGMVDRWRIEYHSHTGGGLFELETTETWRIYEVATHRLVRTITSEASASYDGSGWSGGEGGGIQSVAIEGDEVVIAWSGGRVERQPIEPG